jgi:hypothetical protein
MKYAFNYLRIIAASVVFLLSTALIFLLRRVVTEAAQPQTTLLACAPILITLSFVLICITYYIEKRYKEDGFIIFSLMLLTIFNVNYVISSGLLQIGLHYFEIK